MPPAINDLPDELGTAESMLADTGYNSAANVDICEKAGINTLIAMGRQPHHLDSGGALRARAGVSCRPHAREAMAHQLKTPEGRKLYALRKQTPEPVFGIIKSVMGFRQFSMRGIEKAHGA